MNLKNEFANSSHWHSADTCKLDDFVAVVSQTTDKEAVQFASAIEHNIPIYDCGKIRSMLYNSAKRMQLLSEWRNTLQNGSGIIVLKSAFLNSAVIDEATEIFNAIIDEEQRNNPDGGADHFAKAGANDRIWNALQKFCFKSPHVFARYYGNAVIAAAAEAWLGPQYQVTSQVNSVRPGGKAQNPHRDYHLGFQTVEQAEQFPAHVHRFSPFLTLQGAVAHCDMPIESGTTKLLPFSQQYSAGYLSYRLQDFIDYFEEHCVQLEFSLGDVIFFNPAVYHAAGTNTSSNIMRMANLLQISSAFGKAMESIDRLAMSRQIFPVLVDIKRTGSLNEQQLWSVIAACADGYSFPTNLDSDPPVAGLAPQTQQALIRQALQEGWDEKRFNSALDAQANRRNA